MMGVPTTGLSEREAHEALPGALLAPGLLASNSLHVAMPREALVERFYCDFAGNPLGDVIDPRNGRIAVPQGPGLDVDPDPRLIEKLRK